ncbi:uncharacterized protein EV420DRAFT_1643476 [Desarmillaria tabescens]|uniref:Uncharacterized protein n=1 Tax=Armillaria tabescens TaxID=1929756 RepID=A0AA39KAK3_ARMTA|nr:uncharacterized protein EV420DRAFT_1643476 [Desarmillaria tabescens]KAK0457626.1 hypothetical protein EV420DRAFT_1643476 [Desarmillaria tabescens]
MITIFLEYKLAVKKMTGEQDNGLYEYELSKDEWAVIKDLHDMLQITVLKDVTLYFSCSTPNLATIIPAMDHIDKVFATAALNNVKFSPPMCAALAIAKNTLNVYYNCTDKSKVYQIAIDLVTSEFKAKYKDKTPNVIEVNTPEVPSRESRIAKHSQNMFDNLDSTRPPKHEKLQDELTQYLSTDVKFMSNIIQ